MNERGMHVVSPLNTQQYDIRFSRWIMQVFYDEIRRYIVDCLIAELLVTLIFLKELLFFLFSKCFLCRGLSSPLSLCCIFFICFLIVFIFIRF